MALPAGSEDSDMLELKSLQLDIKMIKMNRETDKQEFTEFVDTANKNFASIQENFNTMQSNFEKLLAATKGSTQVPPLDPAVSTTAMANTPEKGSVTQQHKPVPPIGTSKLQDGGGKELNLDGTPKQPYRHPNATTQH